MTTAEAPDLTEMITAGMSPEGVISDTAFAALKEEAAKHPDHVAYFASGAFDGKDADREAGYAMIALLYTPAGAQALQDALGEALDREGSPRALTFIGLRLCDHETEHARFPMPGSKHLEFCTCGNDDPAGFDLDRDGATCHICGASADLVTYRQMVADFAQAQAAGWDPVREGLLKLD